MAYFTDRHLIAALPNSDDVPPEQLEQIAEDANAIYGYVTHQPGVTDGQLRKWAEGRQMDPDRVNAALDLLRSMRRVFTLSGAAQEVAVDGEPSASQKRTRGRAK